MFEQLPRFFKTALPKTHNAEVQVHRRKCALLSDSAIEELFRFLKAIPFEID